MLFPIDVVTTEQLQRYEEEIADLRALAKRYEDVIAIKNDINGRLREEVEAANRRADELSKKVRQLSAQLCCQRLAHG